MKRNLKKIAWIGGTLRLMGVVSVVYVLLNPLSCIEWINETMYGGPTPTYDLLFTRDDNERPYSQEPDNGLVVKVANHKAALINTGKNYDQTDLFVCKAATGELHTIVKLFSQSKILLATPKGHAVSLPELDALYVDASSIAPDGSKFIISSDVEANSELFGAHEPVDFTKAYSANRFMPGMVLNTKFARCFSQIVGNSVMAGETIHFIGWIIPQKNGSN